jgi:uncharacterized protein YdeI (BOF family)
MRRPGTRARLATLFSTTLLTLTLAGGCGFSRHPVVLGAAPAKGPSTPVATLESAGKGAVTLEGTMTEKCPVAGCWFLLKDDTGVVKVDTKGAGFAVTDVPLGKTVRVTGAVAKSGESRVLATGLSY